MTFNSLTNPVLYPTVGRPPPRKKVRLTPLSDFTDDDFIAPTILGNLLPIPSAPPTETVESIAELLAPYRQIMNVAHLAPRLIHQPRISVTKYRKKHRHRTIQSIVDMRGQPASSVSSSASSSRSSLDPVAISNYITIYDIPDSCWSWIFHFCATEDILFHIGATNKFFQELVSESSTWIHRKVVLPATIYNPSIPKVVGDTLESMFLNWTSLKQLDIMLGTFPSLFPEPFYLTQSVAVFLIDSNSIVDQCVVIVLSCIPFVLSNSFYLALSPRIRILICVL